MWVRVLGTSQVVLGEHDAAVELGARKPRSVLAALALRLGSDVPPDLLVELVWGANPPRGAHGTLHSYLSRLRRVLEPGLSPRERPSVLLTGDHGYRLELRREQVDAHYFADEVRSRHRALAPLATQFSTGPSAEWPGHAEISAEVDRLEELLTLWTGEAYADLPDLPDVALERSTLGQLRVNAEEDRVLGLLALGDHAVVVAATEQATTRYPLQERVWALHALALTRSGRQAEALAALRHVRGLLADQLGLDPGQELRDLEQAVLVQDPALQQWLRPTTVAPAAPVPVDPSPGPLAAQAAVTTGVGAPRHQPVGWRTVGRDAEEADLVQALERAESGDPACALLVGEPGIGKSRLVDQIADLAAQRGFLVATGRCSQDDGAPPLWPWSQALEAMARHDARPVDAAIERLLAGDPGDSDESAERRAFLAWETIARAVSSRAEQGPVLLVLEDLHWADTATLRALRRLVASTAPGQRLAVLVTRRPWPEPTGALAELGEELARRHALRVDLGGLALDEAGALVRAVVRTPVAAEVIAQWHARSEGNPFFLVELARLRASDTDAAPVPATVRDVVVRRLEPLPAETRELLLLASVLGRRCSLDVLAAIAGLPTDTTEDLLAPARDAGLVHEPEVGVLAFTHALTRDAVATTTTPSRLARLHARVAHAMTDDSGGAGVAGVSGLIGHEERVAELARHWLAAGPSHVSRAWRAASAAADQARRACSWVEAEQLVSAAIEAHRRDPLGTAAERIDLVLARAHDCRPNAEWDQVLPCATEAIALARREEDLARLAAAAAAATDNLVWLPQQWNEVPEDTIGDLRWALAELPAGDSPDRCRVMLALAVLLYYDPGTRAEILALAEEGAAMARRIGDPTLSTWALQAAWKALWTPQYAGARLALAREALQATRAAGDLDAEAVALVVLSASLLEMGDLEAYHQAFRETGRLASRRRNTYAQMALAWLGLSMAAMSGDDAEAGRYMDRLYELRPRLNPANEALHVAGMHLVSGMWDERIQEIVEPLTQAIAVAQNDLARDVLLLALARTGDLEALRRELAVPLEHQVENWSSTTTWCSMAEAAAVGGDRPLAVRMAERLGPLSGQIAVSGISSVMGPVDGYLAVALAASGRHVEASAAADRAQAQGEAWGLTTYVGWLRGHRDRMGI